MASWLYCCCCNGRVKIRDNNVSLLKSRTGIGQQSFIQSIFSLSMKGKNAKNNNGLK